jgi:penicillin-binding protein 2
MNPASVPKAPKPRPASSPSAALPASVPEKTPAPKPRPKEPAPTMVRGNEGEVRTYAPSGGIDE